VTACIENGLLHPRSINLIANLPDAARIATVSLANNTYLILLLSPNYTYQQGLTASYWGCSEGCLQFVAYEKVKRFLEKRHSEHCTANGLPQTDRLPPAQYFTAAAFCKFFATVTTYPHEVVRTRLREQAKNGVFKYTGMWQSLKLIGKEEGRRGLYAGMGTHVARVVPNTAIMFLSYELIHTWLANQKAANDSDAALESATEDQ
jgi:Mitochondrial carrier protein